MPVTDLQCRRLYRFGSFVADVEQRRLWNNDELVPLTPKVFQTFAILFDNRDRIVTKRELLETLWPDCYVDEANLTQNISVLRKALGEAKSETKYVVTFPKRGYRFVAAVTEVDSSPPTEPVPAVLAAKPAETTQFERRLQKSSISLGVQPSLWVGGVILLAALSSVLFWPPSQASRTPPKALGPSAERKLTSLTGYEYQPAVSPDGASVAFVHFAGLDKPLRIGVVRPGDVAAPSMLHTPGCDAFSPAWSPDGKSLAYLCYKDRHLRLVIRNEANMERTVTNLFPARDATSMRHLDWSPDGRLLAVCDKRSSEEPFRIDLIHIAEGRRIALTVPPALSDGDFEPRFSPDGKRLAFIRMKSRRSMDVVVVRMPGNGSIAEVTDAHAPMSGLDWTPDSTSVLFCAKRNGANRVWRADAGQEGATWEPVATLGDQHVQLSVSRSSGSTAAVAAHPRQSIWGTDLRRDGLSWKRMISSSGADFSPTYDTPGKRIAFLSDRTGDLQLWVRYQDGREAQLTQDDLDPNYPSWSASGSHLYFSSYPRRKLFRVGLDGGPPALIDVGGPVGGHIAVAPDDKNVLIVERFNIYEAAARGGNRRLISDQGGFPVRQDPSGDLLYYVKSRFSNEIWSFRRSTSEVRLVTDQLWPGCWGLWDISRQGSLVYVTGFQSGLPQLAHMDLSTGKSTLLGPLLSRQMTLRNGRLAVSPDGAHVLMDVVEPSDADIHWQKGALAATRSSVAKVEGWRW